ncbi:MAG: Bacillopeptidase, partial [Dehalococcoidales bacterium]|nr:Bacillopeptidase [Dehalococcoidales bacterium]
MNWQKKILRKSLTILLVAMLLSSASGLTAITSKVSAQEPSASGVIPRIATVSYPFSDNVEDITANNWLADSPWSRTSIDSHSGNISWTDSPGDYYANNRDISLALATAISLSSATKPYLKFWHRYQLEAGFDYGYVELSTDGGNNWPNRLASYSGTMSTPYSGAKLSAKSAALETPTAVTREPWLMEQIDLTSYAGQANVKIRFRLVTDGSRVQDGWYLDDIAIAELPTAVTLSSIANPTRTSANLTWSQNSDASFRSYAIYRSLTPGTNFRSTLVTTTSNQSVTSFMDTGLATKTPYYYRVYVVSNHEIYNASNEQSVTTLAGVDYPFFDNMEAGPNNWLAEPGGVWTLVTPDSAHSGTKAWTESPSANYANSVNATLTLADSLQISPRSQLIFWHRLDIATGDNAFVEVLTENATAWTTLATFTNRKTASWTREQIPLGTSTGNARVRFRITTDASGTADGWFIDDIGIADLPTAVTLSTPVPQQAPNVDKMQLTWTQSTDVYFQSYQIYRDNKVGVDLTDTLVATVTSQTTTSYMDAGLLANTAYYYKVYVVNPSHVYNGSNEQSATTLAPGGMLGFPFSDNMESGTGRWVAQSPWALTQEAVHSGNFSWTDSPASNYANNVNTSLQLTINLGGATMPILEFWQRYSLQENSDFGYIEASTDKGVNWSRIYFVTGNSADWLNEKVDLGAYAGVAEVVLRFRFVSDASGVADGWYIDDVTIRETAVSIPYPFSDNLDSGEGNWISGAWALVSPGHTTPNTFTDSPRGDYLLDNWMELVLAGTIDFRSSTRPQLTFCHKYDLVDRI